MLLHDVTLIAKVSLSNHTTGLLAYIRTTDSHKQGILSVLQHVKVGKKTTQPSAQPKVWNTTVTNFR